MRKIGRNDLCPCDSGKKYKRCCLGRGEPTDQDEHVEFDPTAIHFHDFETGEDIPISPGDPGYDFLSVVFEYARHHAEPV